MKKSILLITSLISLNAMALENFAGKVTVVEPTYLPNSISFRMDSGNVTCPKGQWLKWSKNEENNKAVYSALMAALVSGKKIRLYINDNDTTCKGQYLHLLAE